MSKRYNLSERSVKRFGKAIEKGIEGIFEVCREERKEGSPYGEPHHECKGIIEKFF